MTASASDYLPIRVSTLRGDRKITFDAYVRIGEKFILYCRKGDSFEGERLNRLKKKSLKKLYILKEQENEYKEYLRQNIDKAYGTTSGEIEERALIIQGAQQAVTEDLMEAPDDRQVFDLAVESSRRYVEFILNENQALKTVLGIENTDKNCAHHGVNVASLSIGLANKIQKLSPSNLDALVIGCLLHDIEHYYTGLPMDIAPDQLKEDEKEIYLQHPTLGVQRAKDAGFYDDLTLQIIQHHEELINGTGYPEGLKEEDLDPIIHLVSTCNAYDRYLGIKGIPPKEALKSILIDRMGLHPLKHFQALQDVLKAEGVI